MDRRTAGKRGGGRRPQALEEGFQGASAEPAPDARYERQVFDAKVAAALRAVERDCGFQDFGIFRARVIEGHPGKRVAESLDISEATVSRRTAAVRERLRLRLAETFTKYSFSSDEQAELERNGLVPNPNKGGEAVFDAAVAEVVHRIQQQSPESPSASAPTGAPAPRAGTEEGPFRRAVRSWFPFRSDSARETP